MELLPNTRYTIYHTVIWCQLLIFTSFLSPIHILQRWHCFGFLESSSIDIFIQSHINHKHLKKSFTTWNVTSNGHSNGCPYWDQSRRHRWIWGPERSPFISSLFYHYLCVKGWRWGCRGGKDIWNRSLRQTILEFGNRGNGGLKHALLGYWPTT